jgi:CheY-like chemotaxis protein
VMINEFLDLQRIEDGSFTLALEPFDIASLLVEEVDILRPQHPSHSLELESPLANLIVAGDRERIRQVVRNLVSNAIKYSPAGGRVVVSAGRVALHAHVSVRDEGLGIPAAQQGEIFKKFFRIDSSDTREIGGTGLGLALCRDIVEAHGGRIGFESAKGVGSTFWFELPTGASAPREGRPRVLVIEDEPAAALLLATYAAEAGCAIQTATTGEAGLALALEDPPALICLDVGLAGELDGWQVLARLKESPSTADVPVVICTAGKGHNQASFLGAADFITKPFSRERLLEALHRLLPEGRGKALVVEDDETIRHLIGNTLTARGFAVCEVENGEDALAAIAADRPDVVLLDLMMPRLDGFAVLEQLRSNPHTQFMPVIVITARKLSAKERAALQAQTVAVLEKSEYSSDQLHRVLDVALARSRAHAL